MYTTLHTDLTDNILTVTINRPDKLNAINRAVMSELGEVVEEIYVNKEIKGALITGAGPRAFVAGADISEFQGLSREEGQALSQKGHDIFMRIERSPKPIIAAVNGFALGGGCELAMACHFRVATATARFGQPEVNLGLVPGYGGTQRLTQLIGKGLALELMLTARMVDASEALRIGLVNYIFEADELLTKTKEILAIIAEKAPIAIARIIELANIAAGDLIVSSGASTSSGDLFGSSGTATSSGDLFGSSGTAASSDDLYGSSGASTSDDYEVDPFGGPASASDRTPVTSLLPTPAGFLREQEAFGECFATRDMQEGAAAFLAKRKAHFTGK